MKITYNLSTLPEKSRSFGSKCEEVQALIAFLADSEQKNMCISYDDEKESKRRYDTLRNYRTSNKLAEVFDLYRPATDRRQIIIVKTKGKGKPTTRSTK